MNTAPQDNRDVVTLVIQHKARAESLAAYEAWLKRTVSAARRQPGHLDVNVIRPDEGGLHFTTVVRFADAGLLQAWVNSAERQALVNEVLPLLDGGDQTEHQNDDALHRAENKRRLCLYNRAGQSRNVDSKSSEKLCVIGKLLFQLANLRPA